MTPEEIAFQKYFDGNRGILDSQEKSINVIKKVDQNQSLRNLVDHAQQMNSECKPQMLVPFLQPKNEEHTLPAHGHSLPPEVSIVYEAKTILPGKYKFKGFGEIDLRMISLEQANDLYNHGFPYLKLKNRK